MEERLLSDSNGECYGNLAEIFFHHVNYGQVFQNYAKAYVEFMAKYEDIQLQSLTFEEMVSPREYNFTTDRIFASLSRKDLANILWAVKGKPLNDMVAEMFTSRSGFASGYPNQVSKWPRIEEWDHNQVGAALAAYCKLMDPTNGCEKEFIDSLFTDSTVEEWLYEAADPKGQAAADLASLKRQFEE